MWDLVTFEERIILAAQFGRTRARSYLLCKWEEPKNRIVTALAKQYELKEQDGADARQDAVFWLIEVMQKYRPGGPGRHRQHRVKTLLRITLSRRFLDFLRGLRRKRRLTNIGCVRSHDLHEMLIRQQQCHSSRLDPAVMCESEEVCEIAMQRVHELGDDCEQPYRILQNGHSMRDASKQLRVSYHRVRKMRSQIEHALSPVYEPR